MKRIFILCVCLCMLLCGCKETESPSVNNTQIGGISFDGYKGSADAVMTINGEEVSVDEFNYFLIMSAYDLKNANGSEETDLRSFFAKTDEASGKTYAELAVEDAIKDCTVFHVYRTESLKQGIVLTDEDKAAIVKQANGMKDNYGEYMNELQLKAGGLTPEVYTDITEMSYYSNKLFAKFVGEYGAITDEAVENFYRENFVRAKHILIMTVNPETGEPLPEEEQKMQPIKRMMKEENESCQE